MDLRAKKAKVKVKVKGKAKSKAKPNSEVKNLRPKHSHLWFTDTGYNILPKGTFHPIIESHLTQAPLNMGHRIDFLENEFPLRDPSPHIAVETEIHWIDWSKAKSLNIRKAVNTIQRARFLFRILVHHARTRRLQMANTEDIFTMEVPKNPVFIVDWASKQKYTFEANTLLKDITCRLLTHDGLFENPQSPRNPYTNLPFTQSQMISVWNSIFSAGIYTSSAFALFRKSKFCMRRFILENANFLKRNALSKTMKDPASYDYADRMADFIRYVYEEEALDCRIYLYTHAIRHYPGHSLIKRWAALCYKFYEADLLYNGPELDIKKDIILFSAIKLISSEPQLIRLFNVSNNIGISEEARETILDIFLLIV